MKMKLKLGKNAKEYISVTILLIGLFLSFYSIALYGSAFHNIDLGQNIIKLNEKYDLNLVDITNLGNTWTGQEMYIAGNNQMEKAFFLFGFSLFIFGVSLMELLQK